MNKTILGLVVAVLLGALAGPYATGQLAENQFRLRLSAMSTNNPWLAAEIASYERGWFSSTAVVDLGIEIEQPAGADEWPLESLAAGWPIAVEIDHGPFGIGDGVFFGLARVTARPDATDPDIAALNERLGIPYLFEYRGQSGFGGRHDFDADVPAFTYAAEIGETRFSGLAVAGVATGANLTLSGRFDELGLQGAFAAGAIENVALDLSYEFREDRLPISTGSATVARIVATSPLMGAEPAFELENLSITQSVALAAAGDALDAQLHYATDRIAAGPGNVFTDSELRIRAAGIDRQAASDYYATVNAAMNATGFDPDRLTADLAPVLDRAVRRGFTLDVSPARFTAPFGTLTAAISASIDGTTLDPAVPVDLRNIAVLLSVLDVEANLSVAKPLARDLAARSFRGQIAMTGGEAMTAEDIEAAADAQAGLTLAMLSGQGILADDGTNYAMNARFSDGELSVNGSPLGAGLF